LPVARFVAVHPPWRFSPSIRTSTSFSLTFAA
jgi:hypothetical protein